MSQIIAFFTDATRMSICTELTAGGLRTGLAILLIITAAMAITVLKAAKSK